MNKKTEKGLYDKQMRYKNALTEIKEYQLRNCQTCMFANTQKCNARCQVFVILDIIDKTTGGGK